MILKYKVSLPGLKGFARVYELKSTSSLYSFHKQMQADMDFPQDQLVLFKAVDTAGRAVSRYSSVDLGKGTIDHISLGQCHENGEDNFVYFYDTTNARSVLVTFLEESEPVRGRIYPMLVESKGPNPIEFERGYVAFEDLPADKQKDPDDDEWDDDDEDEGANEDKEETEELYDEDE